MTLINDLHKVFNLQPFTYNKENINDKSIHAFNYQQDNLMIKTIKPENILLVL